MGLEPMLDGAVRGHRLKLDPGDVQRLPRLDGFDVALELFGNIAWRYVLSGALLDLFDVGRLVVIGLRVVAEDHVGWLLLWPEPPGLDVHRDPLPLPLIGGLLVPA